MGDFRIGFVGAGQMARALASGLVNAGLVKSEAVCAYDPVDAAWLQFAATVPGAQRAPSNLEVVVGVDVVVLAIKPQNFARVAADIKPGLTLQKLVISILAGTSLETLADGLGTERVARVMPNTPCLIGRGAAGYACGSACTEQDQKLVGELLESVGIAFALPEQLLDAVTGLSGSGPAFVYLMIEALSDGGVRMGLPRDVANALATQTVLGAAEMVQSTGEHPCLLKERVSSPGGTTIAGLHILESHSLRGTLISAVEAATKRSQELGQR